MRCDQSIFSACWQAFCDKPCLGVDFDEVSCWRTVFVALMSFGYNLLVSSTVHCGAVWRLLEHCVKVSLLGPLAPSL